MWTKCGIHNTLQLAMYHVCDTIASMARTGYITARIEPKLKASAEKVLRKVGVNTSDAFTMFMQQVVIQEGIPFDVCTQSHVPNASTRKAIADLEAGKGEVFTGSTKELFDRLAGRKPRKA